MKQETKELIDWIKKQINLAKENCIDVVWNGKHEYYNTDYEKAMKFLDSLPQIESRLCQGGYILDKNGIPCCNTELVKFLYKNSNEEKYGYLIWDKIMARFVIEVIGDEGCKYIIPEIQWFEKVELKEIEEINERKSNSKRSL